MVKPIWFKKFQLVIGLKSCSKHLTHHHCSGVTGNPFYGNLIALDKKLGH